MHRRNETTPSQQRQDRRGAAAVEIAFLAPLYVTLVMGVVQSGINLDAAQSLHSAVRQAGRAATQDINSRLLPNQNKNAKVITDIKNQLAAEGFNASDVTVAITFADGASSGQNFDLSSSANDLKLFKISVEIPYSAVNTHNLLPNALNKLTAAIVFRKGKTNLVN